MNETLESKGENIELEEVIRRTIAQLNHHSSFTKKTMWTLSGTNIQDGQQKDIITVWEGSCCLVFWE